MGFTPIQQYLNVSMEAVLPDVKPVDTDPIGSRYDDLIQVFGRSFVERLGNLNIFMVGCGALGCEYIKNFALNGVCCGPDGNLTITDNDRIEVSNLNRQFLFRADNVGQAKSAAAFDRAQLMNKNIKVTALQEFVGPNTENIFDNDFWCDIDLVANALDNMKARFYVDDKCVFYEKPLLESGTMGTGFNIDVVVPHMTKSYRDGGQADEGGGVPMCTLRNFPHLIDHCIEWARAKFEDLFVSPAQAAQKFLEGPAPFLAKIRHDVIQLKAANKVGKEITNLVALKVSLEKQASTPTMDDCVEMALKCFYGMFRDQILDLVTLFPEDAKTKEGDPFWAGSKKFPSYPADFDPVNETHVAFVLNVANLFACMLKIHPAKHTSELNDPEHRWMEQFRDVEWLNATVAKIPKPEWVAGGVDDLDEEQKASGSKEIDIEAEFAKLEVLCKDLEGLAGKTTADKFGAADFEKDDDDNFHIDFITACSNLRAANYKIPSAERHQCKMIAGRIIPAIATTTAAVTGLVMMEMYKILQHKDVESLRNGQFSLGTNYYALFEADPPQKCENHVDLTNPDPE